MLARPDEARLGAPKNPVQVCPGAVAPLARLAQAGRVVLLNHAQLAGAVPALGAAEQSVRLLTTGLRLHKSGGRKHPAQTTWKNGQISSVHTERTIKV